MSYQINNTIPPIYTAELMKQFFERGQIENLVRAKIADYQSRHNGNYPAKIFVSTSMYLEIVKDIKCNVLACAIGSETLFGIPLSVFQDDEPKIYLSDEEG